jgi:O-antigen/teichoic acid export membrane protein
MNPQAPPSPVSTPTTPPPPAPAKKPGAARNVVTSWGAFAFSVAVNFFVAPFVVKSLGDEAYGTWVLLASLVGYMGLLDVGVRSAVLRFISRHHARAEHQEAGRMASVGLMIFGAMGLLAITLSLIGALLIHKFANIPADALVQARWVLVLGGLGIAVSLVSGVFGGSLSALQRFDLQAAVNVIVGAGRAVAIVLTLHYGGGLVGLAVVQLLVSVAQALAQYALTRRLYPQLAFNFRGIRGEEFRKVFSFSLYSSLLHVSGALVFSADAIVIGAFLPVAFITFFAIASTLTDYTRSIIASIAQVVTPRASALEATGGLDELRALVLRAAMISTLVTLPITITFAVRGPSFIGRWMGADYAFVAGQILLILAVALTFDGARRVLMSAIIGMNQHRLLVPFYLLEGVVNIALSVYWIKPLGLLGVALGTAIPNLVTALLVIPWLARRTVSLPIGEFWVKVWVRPLLAMVPFAAASALVESVDRSSSLLVFFAGVAACVALAAIGAWFVAFSAAERTAFAAAFRARIGRAP